MGLTCCVCVCVLCCKDEEDREKLEISDQTFTTELVLRRQIYLTIMSSLDFEECAHKLLKSMKEGQEVGEGCGERWSQGMGQQLLQFECELLFMYVRVCVCALN